MRCVLGAEAAITDDRLQVLNHGDAATFLRRVRDANFRPRRTEQGAGDLGELPAVDRLGLGVLDLLLEQLQTGLQLDGPTARRVDGLVDGDEGHIVGGRFPGGYELDQAGEWPGRARCPDDRLMLVRELDLMDTDHVDVPGIVSVLVEDRLPVLVLGIVSIEDSRLAVAEARHADCEGDRRAEVLRVWLEPKLTRVQYRRILVCVKLAVGRDGEPTLTELVAGLPGQEGPERVQNCRGQHGDNRPAFAGVRLPVALCVREREGHEDEQGDAEEQADNPVHLLLPAPGVLLSCGHILPIEVVILKLTCRLATGPTVFL